MNLTFRNARLIDPIAGTDTPGDLHVTDGLISDTPAEGAQTVDCRGHPLAPGIVDMGVSIPEPGARHKESFGSAGRAAARGGITTMVALPDTDPPIDTPEALEYVARRAERESPVRLAHTAALTKGLAGREMTEMGFLKDAGAVAFTDADHVTEDTRVLSRSLTYAAGIGALVIGHPQEPRLSKGAAATSGKLASLMGLPAVSPMAERMAFDRDMALIEMTGAAYHADQVTSARTLPALARAKSNGLDVTAGVGIHHLTLNEIDLSDYRTFFKLTPPLRSEDDRLALVHAVATGAVDVISSMHRPQDEESKRLPFEEAAPGAVALETLLPAALRLVHAGHMDLPTLWRALSTNPARRLGLPGGTLDPGTPADLTLFDPNAPFILDRWTLASKSKNTPFDGARMEGRVLGTWVAGTRVHGGD